MGIHRTSHPNEKDLYRITSQPLALLILQVLRENADESGRVTCAPTLSDFLLIKLNAKGYTYSAHSGFHFHYSTAISLLHKKRLAIRTDKGSGKRPAIYRVDMVTTYEQARKLDLQLTRFLCSDIASKIEDISPETIADSTRSSALAAIDRHKDMLITEQAEKIIEQQTEIERLENLLKRTIRRADEFARTTWSDLKNQISPQP